MDTAILNEENRDEVEKLIASVVSDSMNFKFQKAVRASPLSDLTVASLIDPAPVVGQPIKKVIEDFQKRVLPYCYNFSSPNFMGFPDAGNSIGGLVGNVYADFLQQNLINQSFCSPSGTFAEISVIRWLREVVGYKNPKRVTDIFSSGGVMTGGGTTSNTIGILLARENYQKNCMQTGVKMDDGYYLVVPKGIGHYSVKSAQMWIGCGNRLLEVETKDFRYDLEQLETVLRKYKGKIMALVAYAGDSRTMTVDNFGAIHELVHRIDPGIWLHADACHGFSLGFSKTLKHKIKGIELFDSITTDPHKVMNIPYTLSSLLIKDPQKIRTISTTSDLIMQEQFAFGQLTPFIGSKPWASLKLWFAMKQIGMEGFGEIIDRRHAMAVMLQKKINAQKDFISLNEVEINSLAFMFTGERNDLSPDELNNLNIKIHDTVIREGKIHIHQFSVPDPGIWQKGILLYPLRFMSGNPNLTEKHLDELIIYIRTIGESTLA